MEIDSQEQHDVSMKDTEQDAIGVAALGASSSRGDVLRIVDQTIDDGGAVKYTVVWENGDTTEESVEALGQWDDLVQEYEHSQFSKSEVKSNTPSPPPTQGRKTKGDIDSAKRRTSLASRPSRTKAKANVQYFEGGDDSDDGGEYGGSRGGKKANSKSKKATSSGDDGQDQDQDTPPASTVSGRGYPRRATQTVVKVQRSIESSEGSSDESTPQKPKTERKAAPTATTTTTPKSKKTISATSTESSFVQAHHPFCTRCGQRGEVSKRKSKKRSDDEEDDEPLGSLLLCECCSTGYHRACLRKTYTDSLIGTGFRCEACIKTKGAECLECHEWVGRTPPPTPAAMKPADTTAMDTTPPTDATVIVNGAEGEVSAADGATPAALAATETTSEATPGEDADKPAAAAEDSPSTKAEDTAEPTVEPPTILFRCFRCTYSAHDKCLKRLSSMDPGVSQTEIVRQYRKDWKCHQCLEWDMELDLILAFRDVPIQSSTSISATTPTTTNDTQDTDVEMQAVDTPNPSTPNLSEATIKDGSTFPQAPNTTRELLIKWKSMSYRKLTWVPAYWVSQVVSPAKIKSFWKKTPGPAEISDVVPAEWLQVDKVLDVIFDTEYDGSEDDMDALDHIQSVFVKWKSLDYDQSTWDEPDEPDSPHYASFKQSFKEWVSAQKIQIPSRAKKGRSGLQPRPANQPPFAELKEQPAFVSGGTLKDYQMDGLNWLRYNHSKGVNSILADEMGLGKTIQMVAFVNTLFHQLKAFPCLIVVPNSTLTNWVREFAKWSPDLRVVAYYGPQSSRSVVRDHELFHRGTHDLKCHVVVTTYEMIVNPTDSALFRKNSWECLVVDEGQRLKNENSMLFVKLNELIVENRVLLTGTPLQNNIRELFSLMNFLDPVQFADVTELEKKYENLDKSAVEELHGLLKPFFLRRTKDEVLKDLPPMSEVIVPVGMSALQKEIYKGILARNHKLLQSITNRGGTATSRKASLHNILMELRKCLNHPYLIEGVEPRYLNTAELVHKSLIEAGGKLELLHNMLPKLKQNGHRVLIFSTMTRLLDILEDYLNGERYNFVRLDGSTSSNDRQARIDKFNAPDSDVFVFLLSTRAGGVGVNLATADTILIYDVDFNPKADMQALSRAHRIGQKNKVLVLKFMTRNSAEERIVQIGKKKMILDHLIVERMEDENLDPVDVESILKFGAKALFEEDTTTNEDVKYDDAALEALLDRSKIVRNRDDENGESKVGGFGFAKVWTETKGIVDEEIPIDAPPETEEQGFWSTLLRDRLAMAYAQEEETLGRGARRKTVLSYAENGNNNDGLNNKKRKAGKEVPKEEEEDYIDQDLAGSDASGDSDVEGDPENVINELDIGKRAKKSKGLAFPDSNQSPLQPTDMEGLEDGSRPGGEQYVHTDGTTGKVKKARMQPPSPYQMQAGPGGMMPGRGGPGMDAGQKKPARKSPPCLVCNRSHRDRCPESQDIPLVLERRQQIATSNHPDNYKTMALAVLDRFLLDKQITPVELPKGKMAKNLSAAAARLGSTAYQDSLRSMSIGKAFVPTITPGACIVCNQVPYHLPFKCPETRNVQFMQERCRSITLDPTISDAKKQEYVSTIKALISREAPPPPPPRSHAPPTSAPPTSRRQAPWGGNGPPRPSSSNPSSRNVPTSAAASVILAAAAASSGSSGPSSKHSGQRISQSGQGQGQGHQAYSTQIPPQFMSTRPTKDDSSSNSGQGALSRHDSARQREYNYNPRTMPPATGPHMTIGARESSNYQPRKPAFRGDNGTIVAPSSRGGGGGGGGQGSAQDYSGPYSSRDYGREPPPQGGDNYGRERDRDRDRERERERDHANHGSRHGHPQEPREPREREREHERERGHLQHHHHSHHHDGRLDDVSRSQQDFSQVDNGSYGSSSGKTRYAQEPSPKQHRYPASEQPPQQQQQHQQQHQRQQYPHHHNSRPLRTSGSMSPPPRDDHRRGGQPPRQPGREGGGSEAYGTENGRRLSGGSSSSGHQRPERDVVVDHDVTSPPLEPHQQHQPRQHQQHQQQKYQQEQQQQERFVGQGRKGLSPRRDDLNVLESPSLAIVME